MAGVPVVQVWKGAEDGRLLRVLVRLSSILERPDSDNDPQWAETGVLSHASVTLFPLPAAGCPVHG